MEVFDIMLDETFDLQIAAGDLVVAESTLQHEKLLLMSQPGEWKQWPTVGVGLQNYMLDDVMVSDVRAAIQKGLEDDGMRVSKLKVNSDFTIELEAVYNG